MCKEPTVAVSRSLDTARACRGLIHDAVLLGPLPPVMAATVSRSSGDAAVQLEGVLTDFGHKLIPELAYLVEQGSITMKTLRALGALISEGQLGHDNVMHLTHAVGYTAEKAICVLSRAENCLMATVPR